jgi:hypothetical protein
LHSTPSPRHNRRHQRQHIACRRAHDQYVAAVISAALSNRAVANRQLSARPTDGEQAGTSDDISR